LKGLSHCSSPAPSARWRSPRFSSAATKSTIWTAGLSSGQEVPKQVVKMAAAHGQFKGTLTGKKLKCKLTFSGLTGPAMAAHIHLGAKGNGAPANTSASSGLVTASPATAHHKTAATATASTTSTRSSTTTHGSLTQRST
jgi:hypothetical protein